MFISLSSTFIFPDEGFNRPVIRFTSVLFPEPDLPDIPIIIFTIGSYILIYNEKNFIDTIPTLGLFVVSAFRLLPSLSKIISSLQTFKYNRAAIDTLNEQFNNLKPIKIIKKNYSKINFNKISIEKLKFQNDQNKKISLLKNLNYLL